MPNFFSKMKAKATGRKPNNPEQSFTTQPHPAKTNDPRDLEGPQLGGGLNSNPELQAHHAKGPYIPSPELIDSLEQPASREQLHARAAELNK